MAELVERRPPPASTLAEWIDTATWWGTVRATAAEMPEQSSEASVWRMWDELDAPFRGWLRGAYGASLQAAAPTPRGLHQVAPFLARRVEDGASVVLVVIDGLAFAQWVRLRTVSGLAIEESTGCLTMIPTLTSVSRQAILAGSLPIDFADTLTSTHAERRRWTAFWTDRGLNERDATYIKTLGARPSDVPALAGRAAAIVVGAVDKILHGADVLGDQQVDASVDRWARAGFLRLLVDKASAKGYEVWITSDHGNIPTIPGPVPREGDTLDSAGTRVRLYPNVTLRRHAQEHGETWDPPGVPKGKLNPLFAVGRRGYHPQPSRVSHGGISLDEVIVPFVKVGP
ncbi:MAG: BREX-3 system phosphatase PglZ [Thioalkalivibrio sp.]|nr:BREX-3 system phosphatase PglZ [Thioalkalivibrio sp.]